MRGPTGTGPDGMAVFQRLQKAMRGKGICRTAIFGLRAGTAVPLCLRDLRQVGEYVDFYFRFLTHGALSILLIFKMRHDGQRSSEITVEGDIVCNGLGFYCIGS